MPMIVFTHQSTLLSKHASRPFVATIIKPFRQHCEPPLANRALKAGKRQPNLRRGVLRAVSSRTYSRIRSKHFAVQSCVTTNRAFIALANPLLLCMK